MSARGGRRDHKPNYGTAQLLRQEAGFDDKGGGRQSVDERGRDGLESPCAIFLCFQIRTASCDDNLVFRIGEERNDNKSTCDGVGRSS